MKRRGSVRGRADAGTGSGPGVERVITTTIVECTTKSFDKSRLSYKMREMQWETFGRSIKASMESSSPRKRRVDFTNLHPFVPEAESSQRQQDNIEGCEALIWSMVPNIKGYEHSPLEAVKAVKFSTCIAELQKKQNQDIESLQMGALRTKSTSRSCRTSMLTSRASDFTKITTIVRSSATFFTSTSEWRCLIHSC